MTEDDVSTPLDIKPLVIPVSGTKSILDVNYNPPGTYIKEEPSENYSTNTSQIIGELIAQPDHIAKSIKQEMLDTAATALEITSKHSPSCELNKYVNKHGGISSLQIEDVKTLMSADRAVFSEMTPVISYTLAPDTANRQQHSVMEIEQRSTTDSSIALHMVTNPTSNNTAQSTLHDVSDPSAMPEIPLPVVTSKADTSTVQSIAPSTTDTPLSVVTSVGTTSGQYYYNYS